MDESVISMNSGIDDLSALNSENITCCLQFEKCMSATLKEVRINNSSSISESTLLSLRDHFYCRLPALAPKIVDVFRLFADTTEKNVKYSNVDGISHLREIQNAYFKLLSAESIHADCSTCGNVQSNVRNVFDILHSFLTRNTLPILAVSVGGNESNFSGFSESIEEHPLDIACELEESAGYPELCTSLGISRYSEISHVDDWRFYFEESGLRSTKKTATGRKKGARSQSVENLFAARNKKSFNEDDAARNTPMLPFNRRRRPFSGGASPIRSHIESPPDRFRWDDYDLKQPLVGNNNTTMASGGILKTGSLRHSASSGDMAKKDSGNLLNHDDTALPPSFTNPLLRASESLMSDRVPLKLDGISAEILSATIRRLRMTEQRVSVLESYNNQLRDDNQTMVRRLRQSDELIAALRQQIMATSDKAVQNVELEDTFSGQIAALKEERDALLDTVERLKPLQIQLAGANFEKRLLEEAMEQERKAATQWKKDRESLEASLFAVQALVQRQQGQLIEAETKQQQQSDKLDELAKEKEELAERLASSDDAYTTALKKSDRLADDLEAAHQHIDHLRNSMVNRNVEVAQERARLEVEHARAVDMLRGKLASEISEKESLKAIKSKEMETLRNECDTQMKALVDQNKAADAERTNALICIKTIHERELNDIFESHNQELASVRNEMAVKSEAAVAELREEVEAAHAAEIAEMQSKYEEEMRDQLNKLETSYVAQIEGLNTEHERILSDTTAKFEAKIAAALEHSQQVERESNETIERLGSELEAALTNQSQMLNSVSEQDSIVSQLRLRIDTQNQELEAALIERTNLFNQIEQMRLALDSFTEGQVAAAVANVRSEAEIQVEQLTGQLELAKRQLEDTHSLLVMAGQANVDLRTAMETQQQSHSTQLEQQRSIFVSDMATLQQEIVKLESQLKEIDGLKSKIAELTEQRRDVETAEVMCMASFDDDELITAALETQNKMFTGQLSLLKDESKRVQDEMVQMHAAELERAHFIHTQKMNEIKVAMQIQLTDTVSELKKLHEEEISELEKQHTNGRTNGVWDNDDYEGKLSLLKQQCELDRESAVINERERLLTDHAENIKQLKAEWEIELKKWQCEVEIARNNLDNVTEERNQLKTRLDECISQKNDIERKVHQYCGTIEEQRLEFSRRLEVGHNDLRSEFENMLQNVSSKLEMEAQLKRANFFIDFQQRFDAKVTELVSLREQHKAAMSKAEARIDELQQLADQYLEEKLELEEKFGKERTELKKEIDRINVASEENIKSVIRETEGRLIDIRQTEEKELLKKVEEDHREEIARISAKYEDEIRRISSNLNVKMEEQLKELSKQTAAIDSAVSHNYREKLSQEISTIERDLLAEFRRRETAAHEEFDRAHEAELSQLEAVWLKRVEELEMKLAEKTEECRKAYEETEQIQETSRRMAELMSSDYEQQIAMAAENASLVAKKEAEIQFSSEKEKLKQEAAEQQGALEAELRHELDALSGKTADLELCLTDAIKAQEDLRTARDDAIKAANLAAKELVTTSGQSLGVFRLLTQFVQHVQSLITDRSEQLLSRPAIEGDNLLEALAIIRDRNLPSLGCQKDGAEDIARPFQEVQMWVVEKFDSLLALVDATLAQSDLYRDFVDQAKSAIQEREKVISSQEKSITSAENLLKQQDAHLRNREDEMTVLKSTTDELKDAIAKLDVELQECRTRELNLIDERNFESEKERKRLENRDEVAVQCQLTYRDEINECEMRWTQRVAELDAAATRRIEQSERELAATQLKLDELTTINDKMRIDYEHRLTDAAENLATKESALKSLRTFLDEQTVEREAEQDEYQKTIMTLQQSLSERLRALESANSKLVAVDELQKEMDDTSKQLLASQERMSELQLMLADTEDRLRNETGRFQSRLQAAQAEKLKLENDIARARGIISNLEGRITTDRFDSFNTKSDNSDRLFKELVETRSRWEAQSVRLEALESELKHLAEEKRDCLVNMEDLKNQLEESQKKLVEAENACTAALSRFQTDIESRERNIASLQAALTDRDVQLQTLENTSRQLLNERSSSTEDKRNSTSTPQFNRPTSPSFTVNSYMTLAGGYAPSTIATDNLEDREQEIEQLRTLVDQITDERNKQIAQADVTRRSLEDRLMTLETKLSIQNEEMETRLRNVASAYEHELSVLRTAVRKQRHGAPLRPEDESIKIDTDVDFEGDKSTNDSTTAAGSLSIIAAELSQEFAVSDKLDAALLRRAAVDTTEANTPSVSESSTKPANFTPQPQMKSQQSAPQPVDGHSFAGLVTPSTSGSSPSDNSSSASSLLAILRRLEDLSTEILKLSDPDTYLLSGVAEGSMMAERLQAVLHKLSPSRSIGVGTEVTNVCGVLEDLRFQVDTLASRWNATVAKDGDAEQKNEKKMRYGDFILEISRLLDTAIDQMVSIVVPASTTAADAKTGSNVDAVRQLVHVTTQLSSDFSTVERQALISDCQTLSQRVREMENELTKDKTALVDSQKEVDELHEKLRVNSGEIDHLQAKLESEQQQRFDAASACEKLRNQLDESYAEIERARRNSDQMYSSMHEFEDMKRSYDSVVEELREKRQEADRFESKLSGIKQAFTAQLDRQQAVSARLTSEAEASREKLSKLSSELADIKRSHEITVHERDRMQTEVDRLLNVLTEQEKRAQEIGEKYEATELERCRLSGEMEALRDELRRGEMNFSAKSDAALRQFKDTVTRIEGENETLRQDLITAEHRASSLSRDLDRALVSVSQGEDRISTLSHQLDARSADVSRLSSRLSELEAAGVTHSELERLRQRLSARDMACERVIEQTATLRARLAELTARLTPIRTQLLLAAARANAIVASVSDSVVLGSFANPPVVDVKSSNAGAVSVAVACQLESCLRLAANELDQLISPVTATSNGTAVFNPDDAISPPEMFQNDGIEENSDDYEYPSTGILNNNNTHQMSAVLQQNKELGDTIYRLSIELRQARRTAANEKVSSTEVAVTSQGQQEKLTVARQQLRELTAKYVRAEGHRKALVYQKRYLMLVIGDFRDTERQILVKLKAMDTTGDRLGKSGKGRLFPKSWHSRANANLASSTHFVNSSSVAANDPSQRVKLPALAVFRAAASSIIFIHRTRKLSKKWRRFTGNAATQLTERIVRSKTDFFPKETTPSAMSLFSSSANRRPGYYDDDEDNDRYGSSLKQTATVSHTSTGVNAKNGLKMANDVCYNMTATASGTLGTASLENGGFFDLNVDINEGPSNNNDDTYLNRLEMVRNRLRECRTASGKVAASAASLMNKR